MATQLQMAILPLIWIYIAEIDKNITVRLTLCTGGWVKELCKAKNNLREILERMQRNLKLEAKWPLTSKKWEDDGASKSKQHKLYFYRLEMKMFNPW